MGATPYRHRAWKAARRQVLERDDRLCQIRRNGCTTEATEVDHIVPWAAGGAWFDPSNLRAACKSCNSGRVSSEKRSDGWRRADTAIVLVVGPPGAGKSTLVDGRRSPGDVVIDYDKMAEALGSDVTHGHGDAVHDVTMAARNAVLRRLRAGELDAGRVWLVSSNPNAEQMFPHHVVELVDPGRDEVVRRAVEAGRPGLWLRLIDEWYAGRGVGGREW